MSMNKYMHPRNIYKSPPNFKKLAIDYPEFRKYVKQELSGKVAIDFQDVNALRALSCTLLKKDFDLNVDIPLNKLIPTIPLRFNYLLWIEDLLSISGSCESIKGIDIGTGASCIYPLIGSKKYKWFMLATEIDPDSYAKAQENVVSNELEDHIRVMRVKGDSLLLEAINNEKDHFNFCMCNPPFFASSQELNPHFKGRKLDRPRPKNAFCATITEVVAKGGEVDFVSRIVKESKEIQDGIKIYTSMVGHKSSLAPLKTLLREMDVTSFKQTEFCQGNTTRWGLAWTYCDIDLRKVPQLTLAASKQSKPKPPLYFELPTNSKDFLEITNKLTGIFNELQIDHKVIKKTKSSIEFLLKAYQNSWSHQRRKRREKKRLNSFLEPSETEANEFSELEGDKSPNSAEITSNLAELAVHSPTSSKREYEEDSSDGYYKTKKMKLETDKNPFYMEFSLQIHLNNDNFLLEMQLLQGTASRDSLHQIMQYLKNNLI